MACAMIESSVQNVEEKRSDNHIIQMMTISNDLQGKGMMDTMDKHDLDDDDDAAGGGRGNAGGAGVQLVQVNCHYARLWMAELQEWGVTQKGTWMIATQEPYVYKKKDEKFGKVVGWSNRQSLTYANSERPRAAVYQSSDCHLIQVEETKPIRCEDILCE